MGSARISWPHSARWSSVRQSTVDRVSGQAEARAAVWFDLADAKRLEPEA
jgi:hypothetical protein